MNSIEIIKSISGINYVINNSNYNEYKIGVDINFNTNNQKYNNFDYIGFYYDDIKEYQQYLILKYEKINTDNEINIIKTIKNKSKLLYSDNIDPFSERDIVLSFSSNMFWIYLLNILIDLVEINDYNNKSPKYVYESICVINSIIKDKEHTNYLLSNNIIKEIHIYNIHKPSYEEIEFHIKEKKIKEQNYNDIDNKIFRLKLYASYLIYLNPLMTDNDLQTILYSIFETFDIQEKDEYKTIDKKYFSIKNIGLKNFAIKHGKYIMSLNPYIIQNSEFLASEENDEKLVFVE